VGDKIYNVLFISTGNSARSILAEALLNDMGMGGFRACSAGSQPTGCAIRPGGEFAAPGAPELEFVLTVCDQAACEVCPVWPGQPMTAHWGMPEPASMEGSDAVKARAFLDAAITVRRQLNLMLSLPIQSLDSMALRKQVQDIGAR
jgi:arsenate reductase